MKSGDKKKKPYKRPEIDSQKMIANKALACEKEDVNPPDGEPCPVSGFNNKNS